MDRKADGTGKPMRLYLLLTTALLLALATQSACNKKTGDESRAGGNAPAVQAQATPPADGVRRISISELQAALEKGEAVAVDVRGSVEYKLGHIKGSLSLPLGLIAEQGKELPRDKLIVTYCACTHEQWSVLGVQELNKHGIEKAAALVGGWNAWVEAKLPIEETE
jgi:rhodanese-related sulfurtransferase